MQSKKSFVLPASKEHFARGVEFHTSHTRISLKLDLEKRSASGSCLLRVAPVGGPRSRFELDACEMSVSKVTLDGREAQFSHDGRKITLEASGPVSGEHEIEVWYSVHPRIGLYFIAPDEGYPDKPLQAWTQSEAEIARYWFPCRDFPNDKGTSETLITVPSGNLVVSNGVLVEVKEKDGWVTFHWREETPHSSYLTSFVAGKFAEINQEAEGVRLSYVFPEAKKADALRYFGETPRMMTVFREVTGVKYPYPKYAQTTVEDFTVGGMENISATTLATSYFPDERSAEDFSVTYAQNNNPVSLVAHELAHQWFGDYVTCSDWSHAWLNEGFATYMQALYLERTRGVDEFRYDMGLKASLFFEEDEMRYRRPVVDNRYAKPGDLFDRVLYEKASWMLHELRYLMGDERFFRGIGEYLAKFSAANADTHDFRKSMEAASGLSLQQFFEQSFFKGGYPEFEISYEWDAETSLATVRVKQVQETDVLTPVFRLPAAIVFYTQSGRSEKRIRIDSQDQSFSFGLDSKPRIVEFDPQEWLLKKAAFDKGEELLLNQVAESRDASSRALAAKELSKFRSAAAVEGLVRAGRDAFWQVGAAALTSLGAMETDEALSALIGFGVPENRRVRRALVEAMGHYRSEKGREIAKSLLLGDPSPYVQCEAALSLAKMHGEGVPKLLEEAMKIQSPNDTLAEACLEAMGKLKDDALKPTIWENAKYGKPYRRRLGALRAVKARGSIDDAEFGKLAEMAARDKEFRIRLFIVSEIAPALMDGRFTEVLESIAESDPDADGRVARRAREVLRDMSDAPNGRAISELKEEVERLKEDNRALKKASG